jgi:hypothetical protein
MLPKSTFALNAPTGQNAVSPGQRPGEMHHRQKSPERATRLGFRAAPLGLWEDGENLTQAVGLGNFGLRLRRVRLQKYFYAPTSTKS